MKRRKADVLENWFSLTPRRWPWGFWFEVGWEVKQKRIRKRDFAKVRLVIRRLERSEKWKSRTL